MITFVLNGQTTQVEETNTLRIKRLINYGWTKVE